MNRELNPQLFGTQTQVEKIGSPVDPSRPATGIMGHGAEAGAGAVQRPTYPPIDVKALEHQMGVLRVAMIQMEKRTESLTSKVDDLARTVHARLERFSQAIVRMEEIQNSLNQDGTAKFAQVWAKVNERKVSDNKVQELIDRHNTIVRNFENRMTSLQRVVSEQELALHNAQALLEEARAELSKRMRS